MEMEGEGEGVREKAEDSGIVVLWLDFWRLIGLEKKDPRCLDHCKQS